MDADVLFAGVPISDLAESQSWYERLLGRPADIPVADDEVMWRIADHAWLYIVVDSERAGRSLVALSVRDLDAVLAEVEGRGVVIDSVETVGDAGRRASARDPDGNTIAIIEVRQPNT